MALFFALGAGVTTFFVRVSVGDINIRVSVFFIDVSIGGGPTIILGLGRVLANPLVTSFPARTLAITLARQITSGAKTDLAFGASAWFLAFNTVRGVCGLGCAVIAGREKKKTSDDM